MELGSDRDYTNNFDFVKYWSHHNLNPQRNCLKVFVSCPVRSQNFSFGKLLTGCKDRDPERNYGNLKISDFVRDEANQITAGEPL